MNSYFLSLIEYYQDTTKKEASYSKDGYLVSFSCGSFQERISIKQSLKDVRSTQLKVQVHCSKVIDSNVDRGSIIERGEERFFSNQKKYLIDDLRRKNLFLRTIPLFSPNVGLLIKININLIGNNCFRFPEIIVCWHCENYININRPCNHTIILKNGTTTMWSKDEIVSFLKSHGYNLPSHFKKRKY